MLKHTLIMSIGTWVYCASAHDVSHSHLGVVLLCHGVLMPLFGLFLWHLIFLSCFWFAYFSPPLVNSVTCCFVDMCLCVTKTLWCIPCRTPREITVMNIHKAICNIPFLDFLTNKHMKILNKKTTKHSKLNKSLPFNKTQFLDITPLSNSSDTEGTLISVPFSKQYSKHCKNSQDDTKHSIPTNNTQIWSV